MNFFEHMIEVTQAAKDEAFRYAKAVPTDKLEWKPMDLGRSVLDQCKEMAMCPTWCKEIIEMEGAPEWNEEVGAEIERQQSAWLTVEDCEQACQERLNTLYSFFRTMPEERLTESKWLPYSGGRDHTMKEMMDYPRWNFNYHLGQIAYIQTLLGDKEMY